MTLKRDGLIARVNFPLYTVQMLTSRHVLVGGGGGASKTGVANGFEIFELSHDGDRFVAEEVIRHETGPSVVMNCSTFSDSKHTYIVAGQESHCQLYNVKDEIVTIGEEDIVENVDGVERNGDVRRRRRTLSNRTIPKNHTGNADNNLNNKRLTFAIQSGDSVQTDFAKNEPLQRVVRICHTGKFMATGGVDGLVRLWKFPGLQAIYSLKCHTKEIDDIDFCPFQQYIATVAKDSQGVLWEYKTGKLHKKLIWQQPDVVYNFKRCRFGKVEGEDKKSTLYTLCNPAGPAKNQKSFLQMWDTSSGTLRHAAEFDESLASLAVRDDGRFVAVGTMFSGSVSIFVAFSLQRVLHVPGAHSMFVTGLEFLPVVTDEHAITSKSEAAVVSISVDNQVCIHSLPYRKTIPAWLGILVIILAIFGAFLICSFIDI